MTASETKAERSPIKPSDIVSAEQLKQLLKRRNTPGCLFLLGHLLITCVTGILVAWSSDIGWLALAAAMVMHGTALVHWFAPFHECAHNTAFRSPWMNRLLGGITGTALFLIPTYFRYEHLAHHAHTQITGEDPEMIPRAERLSGSLY